MEVLIVDEDAIEVEDQRPNHVPTGAQERGQGLENGPVHPGQISSVQMASGPHSPVRIRMQSSIGRMKILPSPIFPSGPLRPAWMIALTVGSTKSSFTAIWSSILRSRFTVNSCPR